MNDEAVYRTDPASPGLLIILGKDCPRKEDGNCDYIRLLQICNLNSLFDRRKRGMLSFGKTCIKHHSLSRLFPINAAINQDPLNVRNRELFHVNHAKTSAYKYSAIPASQRLLNQHYSNSPLLV